MSKFPEISTPLRLPPFLREFQSRDRSARPVVPVEIIPFYDPDFAPSITREARLSLRRAYQSLAANYARSAVRYRDAGDMKGAIYYQELSAEHSADARRHMEF